MELYISLALTILLVTLNGKTVADETSGLKNIVETCERFPNETLLMFLVDAYNNVTDFDISWDDSYWVVSETLLTDDVIQGNVIINFTMCTTTIDTLIETVKQYFTTKYTSDTVKLIIILSNTEDTDEESPLENIIQQIIKEDHLFSVVMWKNTQGEISDTDVETYIKDVLPKDLTDIRILLQDAKDAFDKNEIRKILNILNNVSEKHSYKIAILKAHDVTGRIALQKNDSTIDLDHTLILGSEFDADDDFDEIINRVTEIVELVANQITRLTISKGDSSTSIKEFKKHVDQIYHFLWDKDYKSAKRETFEPLIINCINHLKQIYGIPKLSREFKNLLEQFESLRFSEDKFNDQYAEWVNILDPVRELTIFLRNWYLTLVSMYDVGGKPDVQKTKHLEFDPDLLNLNFTVTEKNVEEFLLKVNRSKLTPANVNLTNILENKTLWSKNFIIRDANLVLNMIRPNITCSNGSLIVRSNFVSVTSDILFNLNHNCNNVSAVNVIAYEKIFIDSDIDLRDTDISIIAFDWHVTHVVKIDISGSNGPEHVPPTAKNSDSIKHYDGKMGMAGKSGGHFIGIANEILNVELLSIISNGGSGGKGQDGGNGVRDDNPHKLDVEFSRHFTFPSCQTENSYTCTLTSKVDGEYYVYEDTYKKHQNSAGYGGIGGVGGFAGQINLKIMSNHTLPLIRVNNGDLGEYGIGGSGWKKKKVTKRCQQIWVLFLPDTICHILAIEKKVTYQEVSKFSSLKESGPTMRFSPFQTVNDIIELKFHYIKDQSMTDAENYIVNLTNNPDILSFYNIGAFITETLLMVHIKDQISSDLLEVYTSAMIPVIESWTTSSPDDHQVFTYLTATLSSLLWEIKNKYETIFITDLNDYAKSVLKDIEEVSEVNTFNAAGKIKDTFTNTLVIYIKEAQTFINKFVYKVFEDLFNKINSKMDQLLQEINELSKEKVKNIDELLMLKQNLVDNLIAHSMLGVVNVAARVLMMAGPVGAAAGVALAGVSSITEHLVVGDVQINELRDLPQGIKILLDDLEELNKSRKLGHMHVIIYSCDSFLTIPSTTKENKDDAKEIRKRASSINDIPDLEQIERIIRDCIKNVQKLFKNIDAKGNKRIKTLKKANDKLMKYAAGISQISGAVVSVIKNVSDDAKKIETIVDVINREEKSLKQIHDFQDTVYEVAMPMIETFHRELSTLRAELESKSALSLVVKRWEVTNHIEKIASLIAKFTDEFEINPDLVRCIEQVNEAANVVVTLFDKIQYYQEYKDFARHLDDFNVVGGGNIPNSSQYKYELATLRKEIPFNSVRAACNRIINSFTQNVFPFASHYLQSLDVPNNKFCVGDDQTVIGTIKTVKKTLDELPYTVTKGLDDHVNNAVFDSSLQTFPFFIWDNNTYGDQINQLLSGEEVSLFARITGKKNAVKFKYVQIRFTRSDGGSNEELNEILKYYDVDMIHSGNSYYQCDDFRYIIKSDSINFYFGLHLEDGYPKNVNIAHRKVLQGDIGLSPYAMWRIKLSQNYARSFHHYDPFAPLTHFTKNNVNLELYGKGQYISNNIKICKTNLDKYYKNAVSMVSI